MPSPNIDLAAENSRDGNNDLKLDTTDTRVPDVCLHLLPYNGKYYRLSTLKMLLEAVLMHLNSS